MSVWRSRAALLVPFLLVACQKPEQPELMPLGGSAANLAATARTGGPLSATSLPPPVFAFGSPPSPGGNHLAQNVAAGPVTLDFADTDIREVVAQILGGQLHASYTIDPGVHGSVTLHSEHPLRGQELLSTLQMLLGNVGAVLIPVGDLYRVVPAASAGAAGTAVIALHYVSAEELVKVLQPLAGGTAKLAADPGMNALLMSGDPAQVQSMQELVKSFDVDALAGQSYAVLPVNAGSARDFNDAMQAALRGRGGESLVGLVRVVPLARLNAVLIVSSQPRYIEAARRVYALVERERGFSVRSWHVFYLQNSNTSDIVYTLQSAFTPGNVTAAPESATRGSSARGGSASGMGGGSASGMGGGGAGGRSGGLGTGGALGGGGGSGGGLGGAGFLTAGSAGNSRAVGTAAAGAAPAINPLLGGLEPGNDETPDGLRILPNPQNNAVLIYGTVQEEETVLAMLRKIDILPLQVRIDAVIAEVTLNDTLQYGTQFFFKAGGINGILNNGTGPVGVPASTILGTSFPGFLLGGNGQGGAPLAISALQAVTTVNVLSSPEITVVDSETARLQVGALVPYLTGSSQSTISANAPVINSISYQPTGVIMEVTPRVNSGGLVTLDVSQEVSEVDYTATTNGINSPTFQERNVTSRVVVQDGQTIGLAGLIRDSVSHGNSGIPWLKDIPLLGALAGTQNNQRQRTELLVLITPHVIRDQQEMRSLTEDMRDALRNAAAVPSVMQSERLSGSPDPNRRLREKIRNAITR